MLKEAINYFTYKMIFRRNEPLYFGMLHYLLQFTVNNIQLWNSSVGIATRLRAGRPGNRGSIPSKGERFSLLHNVQTSSEAYPATYPMGTGDSFPGVNRQVYEADHSPPSSVEVKNGGAMPSNPIRLHDIVLN
jgi:hypothetical protein